MAQILEEKGVKASEGAIEAIVWSHWHYDHIGDPSTFPGSTTLVVGPGFKEAFMPAYPVNKDSPLLEKDFEGREVREIEFGNGLKIGRFKAFDYFGDGSFYLLDSPGHAIGHMCGFARVKTGAEDSFIFMGGDACHHGGEFRPTEYLPLPKNVHLSHPKRRGMCPGALLEKLHCHHRKSSTQPIYQITEKLANNIDQAHETAHYMEEFDAAENVLVVIAHDPALLEKDAGVEFFPGTFNGWKEKQVAEKVRWTFLGDFVQAAEQLNEKGRI